MPSPPAQLSAWVVALLLAAGCAADTGRTSPVSDASTPAPVGGPTAAYPSVAPTASGSVVTDPTSSPSSSAPIEAPEQSGAELPRGGRVVFPRYRLVGYAGLTGSRSLGRLGIGELSTRMEELEERAKPYAVQREVLPVMEMITTIVQSQPGSDGMYRTRATDATIRRYLKMARVHRALLLLNIQPGRADFLEEVRAYDRWLAEPDVGLALDPEWAMGPGQVPGGAFGQTSGTELDSVARHVAGIVARYDLPEKVIVYHQLTPGIVRSEGKLRDRKGVVLVKSIDGIGNRAQKTSTYVRVNKATPDFVHLGFKIFYEEDRRSGRLMTPGQVLKLTPRPDYVMYE